MIAGYHEKEIVNIYDREKDKVIPWHKLESYFNENLR